MQLELYLQEVRHLAGRQRAVLDEAAERLRPRS